MKMRDIVLNSMQSREVKLLVKSDPLIMRYGSTLTSKIDNDSQGHKVNDISQRLRLLAKFVKAMKDEDSSVQGLKDCLQGKLYSKVVKVVKQIAEYDESSNRFNKRSVGSKLGNYLSACADMSIAMVIEDEEREAVKAFVRLKDFFWQYDISHAVGSGAAESAQKRIELPNSTDVQLLNKHLQQELQGCLEEFCKSPTREGYRELLEITLAASIAFNRRRSGEVSRMPLSAFSEIQQTATQGEVRAALSPVEQQLEHTIVRLAIVGKRGRWVPVLLYPLLFKCYEMSKNRQVGEVDPQNTSFFGIPGSATSSLRSCDAMRNVASRCGAKSPELLTATILRKHVATLSQLLSLKDNELSQLCNFMGHSDSIHHKYYRLPEGTVQQTQVSKILIALHQGKLQKFKGQTLAEMEPELSSGSEDEENFELQANDQVGPSQVVTPSEYTENCKLSPPKCKRAKASGLRKNDSEESEEENINPLPSKRKRAGKRKTYSEEQQAAMKRELLDCLVQKRTPTQVECLNAQARAPVLKTIDWKYIKFWIYNFNKSKVRSLADD